MKGDEVHFVLPEPLHLDAIIDHLRANARFESMLAQRLGDPSIGDGEHPATEAFLELAEVYLIMADAIESLAEKRRGEMRAEIEAQAQREAQQ